MDIDNKEKEKAEEVVENTENTTIEANAEVSKEQENEESATVEQEQEPVEELSELEKIQEELKLQKDKFMRMYSEFENFRRRTAKEKLEMISSASEGVMKDILPILDDLGRAVLNNEKSDDIEAVKEGVKVIHQKFNNILEGKGVKKMDALEKDFDPEYHEALTKVPAPDKALKGKNIDVIEDGFLLNDKVVRFAKVVVGE